MKKARGLTSRFFYYIVSLSQGKSNDGGETMGRKTKKDPSRVGLGSSQVEGQGTTTEETGSFAVSSSHKKQKRSSK